MNNWKFWTWPRQIRGLKDHVELLKRSYGKRSARPQIVLKPLPEPELQAGFRAAPDTATWRSVLAELDEFIIEVSDRTDDPRQSDQEMRFHAGGQSALTEFRQKLADREAWARQTRAQQEMPDAGS